jgi:hypothetical protein
MTCEMITAQHIQSVVREVDRELVLQMSGRDACDVDAVQRARTLAVEHFQALVGAGHPLEHATRTAAKCAVLVHAPGIADARPRSWTEQSRERYAALVAAMKKRKSKPLRLSTKEVDR